MFFGLMRQSSAWECDSSVPSILSAIESNLGVPKPFGFLCIMPILLFLALSFFSTEQKPPFWALLVTMICYIVANGFTILLILSSKLLLYAVAILHVFIKRRSVHTSISFFLSRTTFYLLHLFLVKNTAPYGISLRRAQ